MNTQLPALMADHAIPSEAMAEAVDALAHLVHRAAQRNGTTEEAVLGDLSDAMLGAAYMGYALAINQQLTGEAKEDAARRAAYRKLYEAGSPGLAYRTVLRLWGRPRRRPLTGAGAVDTPQPVR
ncbi:hypothetical protein [Streptomyces sp. NPDC047981]|uniref:hypothetical protein n=1 Tax=Streptomyces sp. NPDC047981 TaxID=3154610 RepID=UPI0034350793